MFEFRPFGGVRIAIPVRRIDANGTGTMGWHGKIPTAAISLGLAAAWTGCAGTKRDLPLAVRDLKALRYAPFQGEIRLLEVTFAPEPETEESPCS